MYTEFTQAYSDGLRPDPILTYADWAKERYYLPPSAERQGLIDFTLTPYLIEPLINLSPSSPIKQEFWMSAVQIAKSTYFEILLFGNTDVFKIPAIVFFGSDSMASQFVKIKFEPGIDANPFLKNKIRDGFNKKDRSTIGLKIIQGGIPIKFTGGVSEKAFRDFSAGLIVMDDMDALPRDVDGTSKRTGQGSPVDLALNRKNARFGNYKFGGSGSPTDKKTSLIYAGYKTGDKRRFEVVCPYCPQSQEIDFWRLRPPKKTGEKRTMLECLGCNRLVGEKFKFDILQLENGARWIPTKEPDRPEIASRQMSSAYSLLGYTWDEMWEDFKKASDELKLGNPGSMITFYNTKLGLPWDNEKGKEKISHSVLYNSKESYSEVPEEAAILTMAVDVQANRLELLVVGHAESKDIYCIEHKFIGGNTLIEYGEKGSPFNDLEEFLATTYKNAFGHQQPILSTAIDMGFRSIVVSPFLEQMQEKGLPIVGVFGGTGRNKKKTFVSDPIKNKYDVLQYEINVNEGKTLINNKLKDRIVNGEKIPKSIHFSDHPSFTEDFFRYLTAEVYNSETDSWDNPNKGNNEPLDLLNYNLADFHIYSDGGKVDWEDYRVWNQKGCKEIEEDEGPEMLSGGIDL